MRKKSISIGVGNILMRSWASKGITKGGVMAKVYLCDVCGMPVKRIEKNNSNGGITFFWGSEEVSGDEWKNIKVSAYNKKEVKVCIMAGDRDYHLCENCQAQLNEYVKAWVKHRVSEIINSKLDRI